MPPNSLISNWACQALQDASRESATASVKEVSIKIVSMDEITRLNSLFRDKETATNVLSFPVQVDSASFRYPDGFDQGGCLLADNLLGDIAICADVVKTEAAEQGKAVSAHFAHMVVHGVLHLLGFDHAQDLQAQEMEQLEIDTLYTLGFPDPYQVRNDRSKQQQPSADNRVGK